MSHQKDVVQLPVENHRIEESVMIDGWWQRLFNKILNCFKKQPPGSEVVDELQVLRERRKPQKGGWRCMTFILNEQTPISASLEKNSNIIEFIPKGQIPVEDD